MKNAKLKMSMLVGFLRASVVCTVGMMGFSGLSCAAPILGSTGPAGGIIFYVDTNRGFALESSLFDQSPAFPIGQPWGCEGVVVGTSTAIGSGQANTQAIMAAGCAGPGTAPYLAYNFTQGGYDDWFLPSRDELDVMSANRPLINLDSNHYHYSSSEYFGGVAGYPAADPANMVWVWEGDIWFKSYIPTLGENVGVRAIRMVQFGAPIPEPDSLALWLSVSGVAVLHFVTAWRRAGRGVRA